MLFLIILQYEEYYHLNRNNFVVKSLIFLGDISYSIYIFHILIILILQNIFKVTTIPLLLLLTLGITILISNFTYIFIEKKFIKLGKN
jgi:peptidoglycan/LPS O-acetylase OafA/YrhL